MINKVILIGHLGRDPELKTLESGKTFGRISLATSESYKDKNEEWQEVTEWHNLILWNDAATRAQKMLKKGSLIYVEGKLATRSWQDDEGTTRYATEVRVNLFRSLDKKPATTA